MYDIANFSFIPTNIVFGPFYNAVGDLDLGLKTADEVAATQTGVDDHLIQNSVKNNFVIFLAITGTMYSLLTMIVARGCFWKFQRARKFYEETKKSLYWNFFLRLWIENYIDMSITNTLRVLQNFIFENWFESLTSLIALTIELFGVLGFPIVSLFFLCKNYKVAHKKEFQQKWGSLAVDLNEEELSSIVYTPVFLARRFFLTLAIVFS